jgi:hypothetical protein
VPVEHISVNIAPYEFVQEQCDALIDDVGMRIVANDYNANAARGPKQTNVVHDSFQAPFIKPVFVVINCVSNSPSHPLNVVLVNEANTPGDGSEADWNAAFTRWRGLIDSVQAPPPELTGLRLTANGTAIRFAIPGQRGRTNQVLASSNLINWTVVANYYGTNGPIVFRETNILASPRRFYRLRRL